MPLETLTTDDNLPISMLVMEREEETPHFHPERDLKQSDWKIMEKCLRSTPDPLSFVHCAHALHILSPRRFPIADLITEERWKNICNDSWFYEHYKNLALLTSLAKMIGKHLVPPDEHTSEREREIQNLWLNLTSAINNPETDSPTFYDRLEGLFCAKILFPERSVPPLESWEYFLCLLESRTQNFWDNFAHLASYAGVLYPDHRKDLHCGAEAWQGTWEQLEEHRRNCAQHPGHIDHYKLGFHVLHMTLLAAKEVRFTEQGVEIVMPQYLSPPSSDLPTLRSF